MSGRTQGTDGRRPAIGRRECQQTGKGRHTGTHSPALAQATPATAAVRQPGYRNGPVPCRLHALRFRSVPVPGRHAWPGRHVGRQPHDSSGPQTQLHPTDRHRRGICNGPFAVHTANAQHRLVGVVLVVVRVLIVVILFVATTASVTYRQHILVSDAPDTQLDGQQQLCGRHIGYCRSPASRRHVPENRQRRTPIRLETLVIIHRQTPPLCTCACIVHTQYYQYKIYIIMFHLDFCYNFVYRFLTRYNCFFFFLYILFPANYNQKWEAETNRVFIFYFLNI